MSRRPQTTFLKIGIYGNIFSNAQFKPVNIVQFLLKFLSQELRAVRDR